MSSSTARRAAGSAPYRPYQSLLFRYLKPQKRAVALLAALLLGSIALQLLNPQIIGRFLDAAQTGAAAGNLALAGLAFIAIGLVQRAVSLASMYVGENVAWTATNALRADLTLHCLRLPLSFYKQHPPGELIERIDGDAMTLGNFFSQFAIRLLGNILLIAGVLALLYRADWRLGLVLTVYAAATLLALGALQNRAVPRWARQRQAFADLFGFIEERYGGVEDIRASGAEGYVMGGLYRLLRATIGTGVAAQMMGNLTAVVTHLLFLMAYALGLGLAANLYSRGAVTIGAAYLVVYYIGMIAAPLENVRAQAQDLSTARASMVRALEIFDQAPEEAHEGPERLPRGPLSAGLRNVSFAYDRPAPAAPRLPRRQFRHGTVARAELACIPAEGPARAAAPGRDARRATVHRAPGPCAAQGAVFALRNVSFNLPPGHVLGLLGRTGSGKTTITRLLFRLYDPAAGRIRLGDVDIRDVPLEDLRRRVGMITQDVQLFGATIRDNLAFFDRSISDAHIAAALSELGLWEWVQGLPDGLDTALGAGGQGLSAGEAQLLAFGRVFLKNPGLVVLDEASSRLDPATERLLERAVDRLLAGRTGIIIAHRLHTVQRADDILIMEDGRVAEFGPHAALAADPTSRFARLLRAGLEEALA